MGIDKNQITCTLTEYFLNLCRVDERKLLIVFTLVASGLGRLLFFPIPGSPTPTLCPDYQINDIPIISSQSINADHYENISGPMNLNRSIPISPFIDRLDGSLHSTENILCNDGISFNPNSEESCCPLEWCKTTPAITVTQFVLGWFLGTLGYAYSTAFTISLISKMIGNQSQVT